MNATGIYRFSRIAPPILSLVALAVCAFAWAGLVQEPPGDEGALAHIYQLVMVGQLPIMGLFLATAMRRGIRQNLPMLGLHIGLWACALLALYLLGL